MCVNIEFNKYKEGLIDRIKMEENIVIKESLKNEIRMIEFILRDDTDSIIFDESIHEKIVLL
jgi:hypothetical protein